jgi:hypothetical protein
MTAALSETKVRDKSQRQKSETIVRDKRPETRGKYKSQNLKITSVKFCVDLSLGQNGRCKRK